MAEEAGRNIIFGSGGLSRSLVNQVMMGCRRGDTFFVGRGKFACSQTMSAHVWFKYLAEMSHFIVSLGVVELAYSALVDCCIKLKFIVLV